MKKKYLLYLFITFILQIVSCKTSVSRNIDGVDIIENKNCDIVDFNYEPETIISDSEEHEIFFSRIVDLDVDSDGNIYILDGDKCSLFKYSKNGDFEKQFCSQGKGPGELLFPESMTITENNEIFIYDGGNQRISILNTEGKYLRTIKTEIVLGRLESYMNNILVSSSSLESFSEAQEYYFHEYDSNMKHIKSFGEFMPELITEENYLLKCSVTSTSNNIAVNSYIASTLSDVFKDGVLSYRVVRPLPYKPAKSGQKEKNIYEVDVVTKSVAVSDEGVIFYLTAGYKEHKDGQPALSYLDVTTSDGLMYNRYSINKNISMIHIDSFKRLFLVDSENQNILVYNSVVDNVESAIKKK